MSLLFVPSPQRCISLTGNCSINSYTPVILQMPETENRLISVAKNLFDNVLTVKGPWALFSKNSFAPICPNQQKEGYLLSLRDNTIQLAAFDAPGLFYGMQTLRQYLEMPEHPSVEINDWPDLYMRSDYLDLRGLYPKFENIIEYIKEMAQYKLNTLVIEYEDKLPRDRPEFCHPTQALTKQQHETLLQTAYENFIDVIPLQQTFGHLEYALKLPEYRHLREIPEAPGELCPLREGAYELAASLIEETARLHPNSQYIHLGCDEVWSLGQSPECKANGKSRSAIAIEYINRLAEKVVSLGKIPIVWHDMLININIADFNDELVEFSNYDELALINKNIVVAIWFYRPSRVNSIAPRLMEALHSYGIKTLPCCSVRANDRALLQNYPCVEQRLRNVDSWCELISQSRCRGMINTNWSTTFACGSPYGLFETSRYTAFYAADRCWNLRADSEAFLERFMGVYHGVYNTKINTGKERRYDYYKLIGQYLPFVKRNLNTARLIDIGYRLESSTPVNVTVFRGDFFPDSQVELDCLRERAPAQYSNLHAIETELKDILADLLPNDMADLFLESRKYPNRLYQRELERILHNRLE